MTRLPSVAQEAEAQPFILCVTSGVPVHASRSHSTLPFLRSMQKTNRFLPLSSAEVRKIRSPQRTGEEWPLPLRVVFQAMELASQRTGQPFSEEWPLPSGPRQLGQV